MPPVARTLALALAPALIDVISVALFRMHLPMQDRHGGTISCGACSSPWMTFVGIASNVNWKNQMRKTLMVSVAVAALLAATGFAAAQGVNQGGAKGSESPAAASPKGDTAAPMNAPAAKGAETATPGAASKEVPQHAQGKPDAKATGETKADSNSKASDSTTPATTSKDMKNPTAETKSPASDSKTTGNAATSATAAPPAEKQTQIVSAIKQEKVEEVTNVNFNISIGTAVPSSVRYYPLSPRIVEIYPEWRGYDFIRVRGKYIILRPHTHEIVYIIEG
jgi:hypothetical protein